MTNKVCLVLLLCLFFRGILVWAAPPFDGTIFIDSNIITSSDSTIYRSLTYSGTGERTMYDRRSGWVDLEPFLFDANFSDLHLVEIQVNPEFGSVESAQAQAERFAPVIGRLPKCLLTDVQTVWIHMGNEPFGGGNNNLLIHVGQADDYVNSGILEETLVHEAAHTSLDTAHAYSEEWQSAQEKDGEFISTYARDYPFREDIAESFLPYFAVRHRSDRISADLKQTIERTIPHRIQYFDSQNFEYFTEVRDLWSKATDLGQGWKSLNWLGIYYKHESNWLYHNGLGWVYPVLSTGDSLWIYLPQKDEWVWTKESVFPYLFHGFSEKWLYYVLNGRGSKFYQWDGNDWGEW